MPKQWIVTGTSMVVEADDASAAVDRAQESSGWHWEAVEVEDGVCTYCRQAPADHGYDRCTACRTWRDEEWCEANGHPHGVPVEQA